MKVQELILYAFLRAPQKNSRNYFRRQCSGQVKLATTLQDLIELIKDPEVYADHEVTVALLLLA